MHVSVQDPGIGWNGETAQSTEHWEGKQSDSTAEQLEQDGEQCCIRIIYI